MVTRESAMHAMPDETMCHEMPIDADHSTMVKFDSRSDQSYLSVRNRMKQLAMDAPEVIRDRFAKGIYIFRSVDRNLARLEWKSPAFCEQNYKANKHLSQISLRLKPAS